MAGCLPCARVFRRVRQQRHCARSFDGNPESALVFRARTALAVPDDLLAIVQVIPQDVNVLVVNDLNAIAAKVARPATPRTPTARPSPARRAAETTSATTAATTETTSAASATTTAAAAAATEPSRRPASCISTISIKHQFSPIHYLYFEIGYLLLSFFRREDRPG